MRNIECRLANVMFRVKVSDEDYKIVSKKLSESIIQYDKKSNYVIGIEYIVDCQEFNKLKKVIKSKKGKIHNSFKNQTHKEITFNESKFYLVDSEEYIINKVNEKNFKIIVGKNTEKTANWIIRIIREIYLRIKEDLGFAFMHGTGLEINGKGVLLLGTSGSGKTTLAVNLLEKYNNVKYLSNDRVFVNKELDMEYFPHATTYAMGTVKNNENLSKYFNETQILEKNRKLNLQDIQDCEDCNTPLTDVIKIFKNAKVTVSSKLKVIIYPKIDLTYTGLLKEELTESEKIDLLEETNFTPIDAESLRKCWIRDRNLNEKEILEIRKDIINSLINNTKILKIKYGPTSNVDDIFKDL